MNKICSIHQPNFFPWLGYFDKIKRSDVFIFLDAVDYPRAGSKGMGSWCSRVKIKVQNDGKWVGANIQKVSGAVPINEVMISDNQPWRKKLLKTIELNYRKAPNFKNALEFLEALILYPDTNLANYNIHAIKSVCQLLSIQTPTFRQSELNFSDQSTQLLINLTKEVGCQTYMCGAGAKDYQDDTLFSQQGVDLLYQNYQPLPYCDPEHFIPGLSVIDYLMWNESDCIW
ncbi:WbqC family protein [Terasakiella pusilla]|uniref:WbqC family protein n=1 Tax=Terasakiella pusilla TaxID=64973 RepID=UPI003AA81637